MRQPWPYQTVNVRKQDHAVLSLYARSLGIPLCELMHRYAVEALNGTTARP